MSEHPTEFLKKCERCKHIKQNTCWASMCTKGHMEPCFACAELKAGGYDEVTGRFISGSGRMEPCPDFEENIDD